MSRHLSMSATFQSLEARVADLEQVMPLPTTMENNTYLSSKRHDGVVTRIAGITASDDLYFGAIDASLNSIILTLHGTTSIKLESLGVTVPGSLSVGTDLQASTIISPSVNGQGGAVKILGSGVAGYTGVVQFQRLDGSRNGFIGFNLESGPMHYGSDTGAGHYFEGGIISPDPAMHFGLRFNGTDGLIDFDTNDAFYYSRSGDTFVWTIGGSAQMTLGGAGLQVSNAVTVGDASFFAQIVSGKPTIAFDSGDTISYDRSANKYYFTIGGVNVASIDASGNMRLKGTLTQSVTP